jgi:hypothetical protein
MAYRFKYTSLDNLTRKLRGRLNIGEDDALTIYPNDTPGQTVDSQLIEIVAEQKEIYLDYILNQIYVLPLLNRHPILEDIVDSLVISDLLLIHFQGSGGYGGLSADISQQGDILKTHANTLLGMLAVGPNLQIPGTQMQLGVPQSFIELPGEIITTAAPSRFVSHNETYVGRLVEDDDLDDFVRETDPTNPFSSDYRRSDDYGF